MQRDPALAKISVRENENIVSLTDSTFGTAAHRLERLPQTGFRGVVGRVDHDAAKVILLQPLNRLKFGLGQHRGSQTDSPCVLSIFLKNISLRAQIHLKGHNDRFAQRVNRRVGDLSKLLPEKIIERTLLAGQHGHGRIVTHRAHCFISRFGERTQYLVTLLKTHLKHLLINVEFSARNRRYRFAGEATLNQARVLPQPLLVGLAGFQ